MFHGDRLRDLTTGGEPRSSASSHIRGVPVKPIAGTLDTIPWRMGRGMAIHGKATSFTSDPETGRMHIEADAQTAGETLLWVPGRFGTPSIDGENASLKELKRVEGGFRATVEVEGRYAIRVSY